MPRRNSRSIALALARDLAAQAQAIQKTLEGLGPDAATTAQLLVFREFLRHAQPGLNLIGPFNNEDLAALERPSRSVGVRQILAEVNALLSSAPTAGVLAYLRDSEQAVLPAGNFFEMFHQAFDEGEKRRRGVYYTPRPVVSYITRSILQLAVETNRPLHFLDPACGCGTFLVELARQISRDATTTFRHAALSGWEVLPVSHHISKLLLPAEFDSLPGAPSVQLHLANPLLAGESLAPLILGTDNVPLFPVILGNPPYANFGRQNRGEWILTLLEDYKRGLKERKLNLNDDFIKFLRWGQYWIDRAGSGMLALITSNTYLRGLTHRRLRESLLESFDQLYLLDLHGSGNKREQTPEGAFDENVFPIKTGVAIGIFVKHPRHTQANKQVFLADLWGTRRKKFDLLERGSLATTDWERLSPSPPQFLFGEPPASSHQPLSSRPAAGAITFAGEYQDYWSLTDIFCHFISGVQTKNDTLFVGFTRAEVAAKVRDWLVQQSREGDFKPDLIQPYLVAPFDRRWIYYDPQLLGRARYSVMRQMLRPNIGLVFMRQSTNAGDYNHFLAVDCLVSDRVFYSAHGTPYLAPLWLWDDNEQSDGEGSIQGGQRTSNVQPGFTLAVARICGTEPSPEQLLAYLYGIVFAPAYRREFAAELRVDFPRVPLPRDRDEFQRYLEFGQRLLELHLSAGIERTPASATADLPPSVSAARFCIGGYPVLERWQKQRRKVPLTPAERDYLAHLRMIVDQTERLHQEEETRWEGTSAQASASLQVR